MGADGWLAVGWPTRYGGRGLSAVEQFIVFDESVALGAPIPMLTINTVGPTIMQYGTDEQRDFFLPRIAGGELTFCIGYSEPDAGTDLASLTTRAVRDGDTYVINGQKTWTSLAADADYIWLAARTDPDVPKHKGISLFCLPMDTPGISIEPLDLLSAHDINHTFFDDCRVPASTLIGDENRGWGLITSQLNRERVTICSSGMVTKRLEECVEWAKTAKRADGSYVIDEPWVQRNLAEVAARLEFLRLANWKVAWTVANKIDGAEPDMDTISRFVADSSAVKVSGTEFYVDAYRKLMQVYGQRSYVVEGSPGLPDPSGDDVPLNHHPHLRRRHQRDAARPDLPVRPRLPPSLPLRRRSVRRFAAPGGLVAHNTHGPRFVCRFAAPGGLVAHRTSGGRG